MSDDMLNYSGDHLNFDPHHVMGPDQFGCYYRATGATHNGQTNRTTLALMPVTAEELRLHQLVRYAEESTRRQIEQMFGTARA